MNEKGKNKRFMFDTNIFNRILDGQISLESMSSLQLYVTHLQFDELCATGDIERRDRLTGVFKELHQTKMPTKSAIVGISKAGECEVSDDFTYEDIRTRLDIKKRKPNNLKDAMIAETALKEDLVLVTEDETLRKIVNGLNGESISLSQLLQVQRQGAKP